MSDSTPRLGLPDLPDTPELYADTVADAFARLDAFSDLCLKGQFVNTPPPSPSDGDAYLIGGTPAGAWSGYAYKIATCRDGGWTMLTPFDGLRAWVPASNSFIVYHGGNWTDWSALIGAAESSIASAATCDLGASGALFVTVTGATTITSFGTAADTLRFVRLAGALTLTHDATSLILPGGANITTAAGDTAIFASDASGNWRCRHYSRASGLPVSLANPTVTGTLTAAKASFANTSTATSGEAPSFVFTAISTAGAGSENNYAGQFLHDYNSAGDSTGRNTALFARSRLVGQGLADTNIGLDALSTAEAAGSYSSGHSLYGLRTQAQLNGAGSVFTHVLGQKILGPVIANGASATLAAGLYVGDMTAALAGTGTAARMPSILIEGAGSTTQNMLTFAGNFSSNTGASIYSPVPQQLSFHGTAANAFQFDNTIAIGNGLSQALSLFNTAIDSTNYERLSLGWSANLAYMNTQTGGTSAGTTRALGLGVNGTTTLRLGGTIGSTTNIDLGFSGNITGTSAGVRNTFGSNASSGTIPLTSVVGTLTQSGTAGYIALNINPTESSTGSGAKQLIWAGLAGTAKFIVDNAGNATNATGSYGTISDARAKTVRVLAEADYGNAIRALWLGEFDRYGNAEKTGPSSLRFGVLAQQAHAVLPRGLRDWAVTRPAQEGDLWQASSEPFAFLALWGVKDLYARIEALAARVAALEAKHAAG